MGHQPQATRHRVHNRVVDILFLIMCLSVAFGCVPASSIDITRLALVGTNSWPPAEERRTLVTPTPSQLQLLTARASPRRVVLSQSGLNGDYDGRTPITPKCYAIFLADQLLFLTDGSSLFTRKRSRIVHDHQIRRISCYAAARPLWE